MRSVALTPDGGLLLTVSSDKTGKLWSLDEAGPRFAGALIAHRNWVRACDLARDGGVAVTGGDDGRVVWWDAAARTALRTLQAGAPTGRVRGSGGVQTLALHPNGPAVAVGLQSGGISVWDARAGKRALAFEPLGTDISGEAAATAGHARGVTSVIWHPDGAHLLSASLDGTVKVYDLMAGAACRTLHAHGGAPVLAAALAPGGGELATGGADGRLLTWDSGLGVACCACPCRATPPSVLAGFRAAAACHDDAAAPESLDTLDDRLVCLASAVDRLEAGVARCDAAAEAGGGRPRAPWPSPAAAALMAMEAA